jgi:predicted transcriptional regulator
MTNPHHVLTARDVMAHSLVTLTPETSIRDAIRKLLSQGISGAPVLNPDRKMVGMLSELDCLGVLASDQFHTEDHIAAVSEYMSTEFETVDLETDIYTLAMYFRDKPVRRFPVVDPSGELVGQVSRRDVLKGIEEILAKKLPRKHYPDYRQPH